MPNEDMRVITIMTRKGGAGKTTLAQALLSAAVKQGKRCLALDADPQQGLHRWLHEYGQDEALVSFRQLKFASHLQAFTEEAYEAGDVDLVMVDTQGAAGAWADELAAHSDYLVAPMRLATKDLNITTDTWNWYVKLRERVDDVDLLPSLRIILSGVPAKPNTVQRGIEEKAIKLFPVMRHYFMHRNQHLDADEHGFLHEQAEAKRNSASGLERTHAKHYDEAVQEASDILDEILEVD